MFNTSAQARSWMFKNSAELTRRREAANEKFISERLKGTSVSIFAVVDKF